MRLAAAGVLPFMLDAVLLTHLHSDHICDLNDVVTTHWVMNPVRKSLRIFGPPRTNEVMAGMRAMLQPDVEYRIAHHDDLTWEPDTDVVEVEPGVVFDENGVRVIAARTDHRPAEPTIGFRIEHDGKAVVLAGDTVPCAGLDELVRCRRLRADGVARRPRATWCRCSASATRSTTTRRSCRPRRPRRAAVRTLVLTHQIPTPAPGAADEWIAIAREHFGGEIVFGEDLLTISA